MLGFGPYSLDLGPKGDEALRMGQGGGRTDVRTDGQIPPVFYRTSGPLPKKEKKKKKPEWSIMHHDYVTARS